MMSGQTAQQALWLCVSQRAHSVVLFATLAESCGNAKYKSTSQNQRIRQHTGPDTSPELHQRAVSVIELNIQLDPNEMRLNDPPNIVLSGTRPRPNILIIAPTCYSLCHDCRNQWSNERHTREDFLFGNAEFRTLQRLLHRWYTISKSRPRLAGKNVAQS